MQTPLTVGFVPDSTHITIEPLLYNRMPSKLTSLQDAIDPATLKLVLVLLGLIIGITAAAVLLVLYLG